MATKKKAKKKVKAKHGLKLKEKLLRKKQKLKHDPKLRKKQLRKKQKLKHDPKLRKKQKLKHDPKLRKKPKEKPQNASSLAAPFKRIEIFLAVLSRITNQHHHNKVLFQRPNLPS